MTTSRNLHITCRYTGIQGTIDLPPVKGKSLEYTHPLAHMDSVQQVLAAGTNYVRRLDKPILAGMVITQLRHFGLFYAKNLHAAAINANLASGNKSSLLKLINVLDEYVKPMHLAKRTHNIPKINLDESIAVKDVAYTILGSITNLPAEANDLDSEEYILRKKLREQQTAEAYRKLEIRRAQRAELEKAKKAKSTKFELADMYGEGAQPSLVDKFLIGKTIDQVTPALEHLYDTALTQIKNSYAMEANKIALLKSLKATLFTMTPDRYRELRSKLSKYDSKYVKQLARVIELAATAINSQTVSVED